MGHAAPRTSQPPPRAWRWVKVGRRRSVLIAGRPPSALHRAYGAYLTDEIDVGEFERRVDAAIREAPETEPPAFPVVRDGRYVGLPLQVIAE